MVGYCIDEPVETYKSYKAKKFKKTTDKITLLLNGINQLSLRPSDKEKLLRKIKLIVNEF